MHLRVLQQTSDLMETERREAPGMLEPRNVNMDFLDAYPASRKVFQGSLLRGYVGTIVMDQANRLDRLDCETRWNAVDH